MPASTSEIVVLKNPSARRIAATKIALAVIEAIKLDRMAFAARPYRLGEKSRRMTKSWH